MNASKKKGTSFETLAERFFRHELGGHFVARQPLRGSADVGDLHLKVNGLLYVIECKNVANPTRSKIETWQREAAAEAENAHALGWLLLIHCPGCGRLNFRRNILIVSPSAAPALLGLSNESEPVEITVGALVSFIRERSCER